MPHPKSMYKMTAKGMNEEFAMSLEEERGYLANGWQDHPEQARQLYVPELEEAITLATDVLALDIEAEVVADIIAAADDVERKRLVRNEKARQRRAEKKLDKKAK